MRCTIALMFALTGTAVADDTVIETRKTFGIDGGIALPTGAWADAASFGFGVFAKLAIPIQPKLALTARAGFIQHLSKTADSAFGETSFSTAELPVFGGARYMFTPMFYGAAELGLVNFRVTTETDDMSSTGSNTNLGMTLGGGYRSGKLDVRGTLMFADLGNAGDTLAVMATIGYDLTAF